MGTHPIFESDFDCLTEMEDFERIKELGRGSFGAAILVRRKSDQKKLVVKEVSLGGLSPKEIADARKEANFLANLNHPNIVRYEGAFEKEKKLHICMEFCEGGDLSEKIKKQNGVLFGEEQILDWFCQTCLAVRYCHDRKILHRDIKTSNIFLHRHGKQVIAFFHNSSKIETGPERAKNSFSCSDRSDTH